MAALERPPEWSDQMIKAPTQPMRADLTRGDWTDFRTADGRALTGRVTLVMRARFVIEADGSMFVVRAA